MIRKYWQIIVLALVVIVFWSPVIFNNEFQSDERDIMSVFEKQGVSINYLIKPHNEHFMPMYKLILYTHYKMFGYDNIVPSIILNIFMHAVNIVLFYILCCYLFSRSKWKPFILSLAFSINSAYFEVVHAGITLSNALVLFFLL
ncbi:MAG: hypothetical protein KKH83_02205, partial [Candidatus Margulisbacteria bacterium]|nr:hypothetical protein [Candidatus Margulisiibacteriota bacterium]